MFRLNHTHDVNALSWVDSAHQHAHFGLQNLPFASFRVPQTDEEFRVGVAIGDEILDLERLCRAKLVNARTQAILNCASGPQLNALMAMGADAWHLLRQDIFEGLHQQNREWRAWQTCLVPQASAEYQLPSHVGDYTDFYASIHHARRVGALFRPDNPLLPNYQWVPIGYHGRASSLQISEHPVFRPYGQLNSSPDSVPVFSPCQRLDYELELAMYVGSGNLQGYPVTIDDAEAHLFGLGLMNDWSARDIQAWEYQPLGPFLSKSFATSLSPWLVSMEALAPYRCALQRETDSPPSLPYLHSEENQQSGGIDIQLEVRLLTPMMREQQQAPHIIGRSNFAHSFWTAAQMLTHHTSNGCNLCPGDVFASGTMSGPEAGQEGCLLELTQGGKVPLILANGEQRTFLQDGDEIIMSAHCRRDGFADIGFGEVRGIVCPAAEYGR